MFSARVRTVILAQGELRAATAMSYECLGDTEGNSFGLIFSRPIEPSGNGRARYFDAVCLTPE